MILSSRIKGCDTVLKLRRQHFETRIAPKLRKKLWNSDNKYYTTFGKSLKSVLLTSSCATAHTLRYFLRFQPLRRIDGSKRTCCAGRKKAWHQLADWSSNTRAGIARHDESKLYCPRSYWASLVDSVASFSSRHGWDDRSTGALNSNEYASPCKGFNRRSPKKGNQFRRHFYERRFILWKFFLVQSHESLWLYEGATFFLSELIGAWEIG